MQIFLTFCLTSPQNIERNLNVEMLGITIIFVIISPI